MISFILQPALALLAEGEQSGGLLSNPLLWRVINLLTFVLVIIWILRSKVKIGQVFDRRAALIVKDLEEARREKQEAHERLQEVESRLAALDTEVAQIRAEAQHEAAREAERIRQSATTDAEKIRQTASREIEGAMKAARSELRAFVAEQSVALAEQSIRRQLRPEDNKRMLDKYIEDLGEVSK